MKYLIAIYSRHDDTNINFITEAENEAIASKKAIIQHCQIEWLNQDYIDWVNNLGDDFESIALGASQSELVLSNPIKI